LAIRLDARHDKRTLYQGEAGNATHCEISGGREAFVGNRSLVHIEIGGFIIEYESTPPLTTRHYFENFHIRRRCTIPANTLRG
jgi:hypothetical protein